MSKRILRVLICLLTLTASRPAAAQSFKADVAVGSPAYCWFAANTTAGSAGDGTTPLYDVRLAGAAAGAAPVASGTPTLLTHADYTDGLYEIAVDTTGYTEGAEYAVFCSLTISTVNPAGFVCSFRVRAAASTEYELIAAIKAKTDNLPASPAAVGSAMTLAAGAVTAAAIATDAIDADAIAAAAITSTEAPNLDAAITAVKAKTDQVAVPLATGTCGTVGAATVVLTGASAVDLIYRGCLIEFATTPPTSYTINTYAGATRIATLVRNFSIAPTEGVTTWKIWPSASVRVEALASNAVTSDAIAAGAITASEAPNLDAAITTRSTLDAAGVRTAVGLASANLDTQLDSIMDDGTAVYDRTTDSLQAQRDSMLTTDAVVDAIWDEALSGHAGAGTAGAALSAATAPSAAAVADAVWDEALTGHAGAGTAGAALSSAGTAGDPWLTPLPGAYSAGTGGYIVGSLLAREATVLGQFAVTQGIIQAPAISSQSTITVTRGDTRTLTFTLGTAWPLAGKKVYFTVKANPENANASALVAGTCTVTDAANGVATYTPATTDFATAGTYYYDVEVRNTDESSPQTAWIGKLVVTQDVRQ